MQRLQTETTDLRSPRPTSSSSLSTSRTPQDNLLRHMARLLYVSYFRITARGPFKLPVPASQTLLIIPLPLLTLSADYAPYVTNSRAPHPDLRNSPQCTQSPDQCPLSDLGNLAVPKPAQRSRLRTLLLGSQDCASRRGKKQLGQVKSAQQMLSAPQAMASISNIQHLQTQLRDSSARRPFPSELFPPHSLYHWAFPHQSQI